MSIHSDPRQYGTDEEREAWKRDLAWEYREVFSKGKIPVSFGLRPSTYGDVPSPDLPECDGEFEEDKCEGCDQYEECEKYWNDSEDTE